MTANSPHTCFNSRQSESCRNQNSPVIDGNVFSLVKYWTPKEALYPSARVPHSSDRSEYPAVWQIMHCHSTLIEKAIMGIMRVRYLLLLSLTMRPIERDFTLIFSHLWLGLISVRFHAQVNPLSPDGRWIMTVAATANGHRWTQQTGIVIFM